MPLFHEFSRLKYSHKVRYSVTIGVVSFKCSQYCKDVHHAHSNLPEVCDVQCIVENKRNLLMMNCFDLCHHWKKSLPGLLKFNSHTLLSSTSLLYVTGRCRLFFGNIPMNYTEAEFLGLLKPYGETDDVFLNPKKGFGFVKLVRRIVE